MHTFSRQPTLTSHISSHKNSRPPRIFLRQGMLFEPVVERKSAMDYPFIQRSSISKSLNQIEDSTNEFSKSVDFDFNSIPAVSNIQAKLNISTPNDPMEKEADQIADAILKMGNRNPTVPAAIKRTQMAEGADSLIQREVENNDEISPLAGLPEGLEEDGSIFPKSLGADKTTVSPLESHNLGASQGRMMPFGTRKYMETRFGYDFSSVRIHSDGAAAQLAKSINAAAFAHGRNIYFGAGRFNSNSDTGRRLLAHELTHVVQQSGGDNRAMSKNIQRSHLSRPEIHPLRSGMGSRIWRATEAHVNLKTPQKVRIYNNATAPQDFETSAGKGNNTSKLVRAKPYPILYKRVPPTKKVGKWGLQYFAWFTGGGHGFHSEFAYPRPDRTKVTLKVDGMPRSHGCLRLHHSDSQTVYNALSKGDSVYIYDEPKFRSRTWGGGSRSKGNSSYIVQKGDSLSEIAERFKVTVDALKKANKITNEDFIRAGKKIIIPSSQ